MALHMVGVQLHQARQQIVALQILRTRRHGAGVDGGNAAVPHMHMAGDFAIGEDDAGVASTNSGALGADISFGSSETGLTGGRASLGAAGKGGDIHHHIGHRLAGVGVVKMPSSPAPCAFFSRMRSITTCRLSASSEAVGSSSSNSGWLEMKPRATFTLACSPPEKVAGGRPHSRSGRLSRASNSLALARARSAATPSAAKGSATTSSAETRGITRRNWLT